MRTWQQLSESVNTQCHMTAVVGRNTHNFTTNTGNMSTKTHTHTHTRIIPSHILSNDDTAPHPATDLAKKRRREKRKEKKKVFPPTYY